MTKSSKVARVPDSTFGERLDFAIRLAALRKGFDSSKELAAAIGKGSTQLSQWKKAKPKIDAIRLVAGVAGVNSSWLDDPSSPEATEPELFQEWLAARRGRQAPAAKRRRA